MVITIPTRAKIIYIIEWVLITLSLLGLLAAVIVYSVNFNKIVDQVVSDDPSINREDAVAVLRVFIILIGVIGAVCVLFEIGMNTLLTIGVRKADHKKCKIWFIIQCVFLALATIGFIFEIVSIFRRYQSPYSLIGYILSFIYRIVSLVIIKQFMTHVLEDRTEGRVYHRP